jgi:tRNA A-37 threonylcarbamoyl transferase component Bud32
MFPSPTALATKQPTPSELEAYMIRLKGARGGSPLLSGQQDDAEIGKELASIDRRPPPGMQILKFGTRSAVGSFRLSSNETVVLKYYFPKSIIKRLTYGMLGSRALQSWQAAHAFHFVGLPTPTPLYFSEQKSTCGMQLHAAFLATRFAPGLPLTSWIERKPQDLDRVRRVTDALSQAFAIMARFRISHGDLKASNIMVNEEEGNTISFIDLDGTRVLSPVSSWTKYWNKDRARLLANWAHLPEVAALFSKACLAPADYNINK